MRIFAQKQNQPQQKSSTNLTRSNTLAPAASHQAHPLLHLQRTIGNQAVLRLLQARADGLEAGSDTEVGSQTPATARFVHDFSRIPVHAPAPIKIQPKLAINTPGDIYEQEADHISEQVMRMPEPKLQRACACGGGCPRCQTGHPRPGHERVQTKHVGSSESGQTAAPPIVHKVLASPGQPLDPETRAFMEPRFGHDFSRVRVHSSSADEQSAREVTAKAYTVGHHIVFGAGRFAPETHQGRRLIAHELAHVVQQSGDVGASATVLARDPDDPNDELARTLAKKLDKKRDEVLNTLRGLADKDLRALDAAAAKVLPKNRSTELRRTIRFVRYKPTALTPTPVTVVGQGTSESKAKAKVAGGEVELHTGVSYKSGAGNSESAYTLTYDGPGVAEMRWLQFVWREVVPEFPATPKAGKPRKVPLKKRIDRPSGPYLLTTDPAKPKWNTDSSTGHSPFYEDNTTVNRSANKLVMFDAPDTMVKEVGDLFANTANPPTRVVSHFHATTYLIQSMDVLYRAEIDLTWEFTDATKPPTLKVTAKGGKAEQLESPQRARLVSQYPNVDYLPGPAIGAPEPMDAFDPIPDLAPAESIQEKDWASKKDLDKYEDIARLAHAEWIDDVGGMSAITINSARLVPGDVKAGLNYASSAAQFAEPGETGCVDGNIYVRAKLPIKTDGPLPRIAIILGTEAFSRDKSYAVSTLRHEMMHAAHYQLAIGWLLKWRDERTGTPFKDWLNAERKAKHISEVDFAVVSTGIPTGVSTEVSTGVSTDVIDKSATEVLAWTEGFVTALRFLPVKPEIQLMSTSKYPAAIAELMGAGGYFNLVSSDAVKKAAFKRIRDFCCDVLDQSQRDALVAWIKFLLDPNSLKPTKADESTIKLMIANFTPIKDFLQKVLAEVEKPCPKRKPS